MDEDSEGRRGFRVTDRRRFADTGEVRAGGTEAEGEPAAAPDATPVSESRPPGRPAAPGADEPVTFSTFVLGLSTQALLHLGEIPNPVSQTVEHDLEAAKHVIDLLGMLGEKTRNNLDQGEDALLSSVLYDLRMRYVELVRRGTKEAK
jgi:hypothetical protein